MFLEMCQCLGARQKSILRSELVYLFPFDDQLVKIHFILCQCFISSSNKDHGHIGQV